MSTKKNKEEDVGPTLLGVMTSAVLMAVVGVILGFLFLSSFPTKAVASVKDRDALVQERAGLAPLPDRGIYFETPASRTRNWEVQRRALLGGSAQSVEFQFGDLNAWAASMFRPGTPPAGPDQPKVLLLPGTPKFGTDGEGLVYVILPMNATVMGYSKPYTLCATGTFLDGTKEFVVDQVWVNNAVVPPVPGLNDYVVGALMDAFAESEEFKAVAQGWDAVKSVEVTATSLQLNL